jgi:hypothetical protein
MPASKLKSTAWLLTRMLVPIMIHPRAGKAVAREGLIVGRALTVVDKLLALFQSSIGNYIIAYIFVLLRSCLLVRQARNSRKVHSAMAPTRDAR